MFKRLSYLLVLFFLCFYTESGNASSPATDQENPEKLALQLQEKLTALESLQFDFEQATLTGGRERKGDGQATFYRPLDNKTKALSQSPIMRWDYTAPDKQVIINNGKTLTFYTQKDQQMIITPTTNLEDDITYRLLSGTGTIQSDFEAKVASSRFHFSAGSGVQALRLIPRKEQGQVKEIHVWFDGEFFIRHLIIEDYFDSVTKLTFYNIEADPLKNTDPITIQTLFAFTPPAGTEIIEQ